MASILIVTFEAGGNVPPALAVGEEFRDRGNRVRVLGHRMQRATVEAAGLEFRAYRHSPTWTPHAHHTTWTVLTMGLEMVTHPGIGRDLGDVVREDPADLVIIDCMLLNALDAAGREGLRHVALFHTCYGFFDGSFRRGPFGIVPRLKGLGPRRLWGQADLALICSDRAFDPAGGRSDDHLFWAGAVHDAKTAAVRRTPLVLVSLSTAGFPGQRAALQNILDAVAGMDVEVVVTTGPAIDPAGFHPPANATVHRYVPHSELMPSCSAVIGHGGHATTFRALAHGIPMVIMPMSAVTDQPGIGKVVAAAGVGKVISKASSPERIRGVLGEVLSTDGYRDAAAELGARLRATHAASAAVDRLSTLIGSRG